MHDRKSSENFLCDKMYRRLGRNINNSARSSFCHGMDIIQFMFYQLENFSSASKFKKVERSRYGLMKMRHDAILHVILYRLFLSDPHLDKPTQFSINAI